MERLKQKTYSEKTNPFALTWNIISTIGGILGFVSFADDFVVWKNIFNDLLILYRGIIHYPIQLLGIEIHAIFIDYLFFGSLCGGSFYKAMTYAMKNGFLSSGSHDLAVKIGYFLLYLLFWPLGIVITLNQLLFGTSDIYERYIKLRFVQWLGAILILFLILLVLNVTL